MFDRHDVARMLHRYIDEAEAFQAAFSKVMASQALVELQAEQRDEQGRFILPARYSTREMVSVERGMADSADRMADRGGSGLVLPAGMWRRRYGAQRRPLYLSVSLAEEQRAAVAHVAGGERIAAVVGWPGRARPPCSPPRGKPGKLRATRVRCGVGRQGRRGAGGISGIASRTLASWEHGLEHGSTARAARRVVIDEAGMSARSSFRGSSARRNGPAPKSCWSGIPNSCSRSRPGPPSGPLPSGSGLSSWRACAGNGKTGSGRRRRILPGIARPRGWRPMRSGAGSAWAKHGESAGRDRARRGADMAARPDGSRMVLAHRPVDV